MFLGALSFVANEREIWDRPTEWEAAKPPLIQFDIQSRTEGHENGPDQETVCESR